MKPKIVCICGSTRFADLHAIKKWELEKEGETICLMISYLPTWYGKEQGWDGNDHFGEKSGTKEALDELHLRKIDLADEVFVINKDGYIGKSSSREIEYAKTQSKPIGYLEEIKCPKCEGSGQTAICPGYTPDEVKKGIASGSRVPIRHTCGKCNGTGKVKVE